MMAELSPPGFENMVCPFHFLAAPIFSRQLVFWSLWSLKPRLFDGGSHCYPGHH